MVTARAIVAMLERAALRLEEDSSNECYLCNASLSHPHALAKAAGYSGIVGNKSGCNGCGATYVIQSAAWGRILTDEDADHPYLIAYLARRYGQPAALADPGPAGIQAASSWGPAQASPRAAAIPAVVARHEPEAGAGQVCACGCGRLVPVSRSGPARRYATAGCRAAVYRRRRAGVPVDLPRQPNRHGRRGLTAIQRT
jgi:hypothetical protein